MYEVSCIPAVQTGCKHFVPQACLLIWVSEVSNRHHPVLNLSMKVHLVTSCVRLWSAQAAERPSRWDCEVDLRVRLHYLLVEIGKEILKLIFQLSPLTVFCFRLCSRLGGHDLDSFWMKANQKICSGAHLSYSSSSSEGS